MSIFGYEKEEHDPLIALFTSFAESRGIPVPPATITDCEDEDTEDKNGSD